MVDATAVGLMEIVNFFETLTGKWFSQRTTHYVASQTSKAGQSNLLIEFLPHIDATVIKLCEELGQDASQVVCGLRINQDSRMDGETRSRQTSSVMVALQPNDSHSGLLLQKADAASKGSIGNYRLENEVLTIVTGTSTGQAEERLWFLNPNLRMRTSVLKEADGVTLTSFCSEIRMGLNSPAKTTDGPMEASSS
ncbi:MAG TPA: phycobiliprotein lyase [Trichocoleus sp.]